MSRRLYQLSYGPLFISLAEFKPGANCRKLICASSAEGQSSGRLANSRSAPMASTSPKYLLALLAFVVLTPLQASLALAHDEPQKRTISLVGTGPVKTTPDKVDISTGVTSEAQSAREAPDQHTEAMAKVVEALKGEGIEPKDIQTTNFSVSPVYEQRKEGMAPFIVGYRITNAVRITVRDTKRLGAILAKVVRPRVH